MLNTETNTPEMEARIRGAFDATPLFRHSAVLTFEHGPWWVSCSECGAQWSVVDAEGGRSIDGFDFEEVTAGEEPECWQCEGL